ncbi:hypothetical protein [Sphingomonas sp. SRS2]|uniref:hypothetical protein n=1 Tax=Sphingomonas sp. SRS2 TaxID=133190 RepID=UPI0006184A5A|nr:hypothetical protein [Sphingomonas sp. SRS2]KKC26982.1 hypothetical protein WP12_05845 [Sphingomonas sp. SRS2]
MQHIRSKAGEIVTANPRWDRRFWNLQVTDVREEVIELRVLVTARDAAIVFDLRCDVREALLAFIAQEMPEALPRCRQLQLRD